MFDTRGGGRDAYAALRRMSNDGRCPRCDGPTVHVTSPCRWCSEENDGVRIATREHRQPGPYEMLS